MRGPMTGSGPDLRCAIAHRRARDSGFALSRAPEWPDLARQRDRGAAELAVGTHHDRLLGAGVPQREVGVEAGRAGHDLEVAAAAAALQRSGNVAAALAPAAGDRAALRDDVAGEVELVGVAGAGQRHLHAGAGRCISGAAPNALARSV